MEILKLSVNDAEISIETRSVGDKYHAFPWAWIDHIASAAICAEMESDAPVLGQVSDDQILYCSGGVGANVKTLFLGEQWRHSARPHRVGLHAYAQLQLLHRRGHDKVYMQEIDALYVSKASKDLPQMRFRNILGQLLDDYLFRSGADWVSDCKSAFYATEDLDSGFASSSDFDFEKAENVTGL
ncbi:hypothetical protein FE257_002173 [Aspergillus nanangensis]|uniref:Uncharacterized protein n=1 Tax=Aspergillus nanangensis TaxID=2582783 RepID=A0AAD4CTF9_ASPNN|nr:hypothetical protein FE257_002173 [Aspergillus nanangensis]